MQCNVSLISKSKKNTFFVHYFRIVCLHPASYLFSAWKTPQADHRDALLCITIMWLFTISSMEHVLDTSKSCIPERSLLCCFSIHLRYNLQTFYHYCISQKMREKCLLLIHCFDSQNMIVNLLSSSYTFPCKLVTGIWWYIKVTTCTWEVWLFSLLVLRIVYVDIIWRSYILIFSGNWRLKTTQNCIRNCTTLDNPSHCLKVSAKFRF